MKGSPGISFVTGPMGSGKTLFACRKIADALYSGKYVVTNVRLKEGWEYKMVNRMPQFWLSPWSKEKKATFLRSLYVYESNMEETLRYRFPGTKEARALYVWDEGHNDLNNRDWNVKEERARILEWATQLRKIGVAGYLLTQHRDNVDAALRRIVNNEIRLRNQREAVRVLGMRVCPIPFFLAVWYPANVPKFRGDSIIHIERYFLSWHKKIYNTHDLFHGLDRLEDHAAGAFHLPKPGAWNGVKPEPIIRVAPAESLEESIQRLTDLAAAPTKGAPSRLRVVSAARKYGHGDDGHLMDSEAITP